MVVIVTTARFPIITPNGEPLVYQGKASGEPHEVPIPRMHPEEEDEKNVSFAGVVVTQQYVLTEEESWTLSFLKVAEHPVFEAYWWSFPEL